MLIRCDWWADIQEWNRKCNNIFLFLVLLMLDEVTNALWRLLLYCKCLGVVYYDDSHRPHTALYGNMFYSSHTSLLSHLVKYNHSRNYFFCSGPPLFRFFFHLALTPEPFLSDVALSDVAFGPFFWTLFLLESLTQTFACYYKYFRSSPIPSSSAFIYKTEIQNHPPPLNLDAPHSPTATTTFALFYTLHSLHYTSL